VSQSGIKFVLNVAHCLIVLLLVGNTDVLVAQAPSILTRIPCEVTGDEGLVVCVKPPRTERYGSAGAPVAVYLPGGFQGVGIGDKDAELVRKGFIEISFNFPGSGLSDNQSGGSYDNRGPQSLIAARDVIRFALGDLADTNGKYLSDIVNPIVPLHTNVGLIGYSYGGVTNVCVAGVHGDTINRLAWILNWESPVGDGMPQAEAGSKPTSLRPFNPEVNPVYNPDTGDWDLTSLSYDASIRIGVLDSQEEVVGGLYFDNNGNSAVDHGTDFIAYPLVFEIDGSYKAFYSDRLRMEAETRNLFPDPLPSHIPTLDESITFWHWRNGEYRIDSTLYKIPQLMFMVVASEIDHVQRARPSSCLIQYEGFRTAGLVLFA